MCYQVTANQTDDQHMFLAHRLAALEEGWNDLQQMWENKQAGLDQSLKEQIFLRDATQSDILLNQQEHLLSKEEVPVGVIAALVSAKHVTIEFHLMVFNSVKYFEIIY